MATVEFNKFLICCNLRCWNNNGVYTLWSKGYRLLSWLKISFTEIAGVLSVWKCLSLLWGGTLTDNNWLINGKFETLLITQLNTEIFVFFKQRLLLWLMGKVILLKFMNYVKLPCKLRKVSSVLISAVWGQAVHFVHLEREKVIPCFLFFVPVHMFLQTALMIQLICLSIS